MFALLTIRADRRPERLKLLANFGRKSFSSRSSLSPWVGWNAAELA